MSSDLVTSLLPGLGKASRAGFNVFDVMRHGTHEKQLSNAFAWLLDAEGSHGLGDLFQRIFIDSVDGSGAGGSELRSGRYKVRQEVDTSSGEDGQDIADLVLETDQDRLVIENYFTSDGHGHSYDGYLDYARRDGHRGAVVLLCRDEDSSRQTDGWEQAAVLTYGTLLAQLRDEIPAGYQQQHPEASSFIDQMHRKFVTGRGRMDDHQLVDFVTAMCTSGEAGRYGDQSQDAAASKFGEDVAIHATEIYGDGRELLQRVKSRLKDYCERVLQSQLNESLGASFVRGVNIRYQGIYQWTINLQVDDDGEDIGEGRLQIKFGPSAWKANEHDTAWRHTVDPATADYSHLFLTRARFREVRQSAVTLQDVLHGLSADDRRLHDEIVAFWTDTGP